MGSMILCRSREAVRPLKLSGGGINIYSAEELCYYIYNNIYLISNDFVDAALLSFLRDEVGETALAERLEYLRNSGAGLAEMIVTILKTVDYYSLMEIEEIRGVLGTLGNQNVFERLKVRGDSFLNNKCYFSAIECYKKIADDTKGGELGAVVLSKVHHNMGVAFARMFMYEDAAECFKNAYKIGQFEESRKCYNAAVMMRQKDSGPMSDDVAEEEYVVKKEMETLMDNARFSNEYRQLEEIYGLKKDGRIQEFNEAVGNLLENWKDSVLRSSQL